MTTVVIKVNDAVEFYKICLSKLPYDIFVSTAAIADWKVKKKFSNKIKKNNSEIILTEKEIQLLELFLNNKKPISKDEILSSVWNY